MDNTNFSIASYINDHVYMLGGDVIEVELLIEKDEAVVNIKDWFGSNARIKTIDDKIIACVKCNETSLIYWIMQYGEYIKILSPKKLIDEVLEVGHRTLDKYNI